MKAVEKIKIHILCLVTFSENRVVYEIISNHMVDPQRPQMVIWRRVAWWISKVTRAQTHARAPAPTLTHTHSRTCVHSPTCAHTEVYNTYCFFTETGVSRTRLSVMLYVHCLSCLYVYI